MSTNTNKHRPGFLALVKTVATRIWTKIQAEPVIVRTVLGLLVSAGVLELTDADLNRVDSIVLVIVLLVSAASARGAVTPLPPEERKHLVRRNRRKAHEDGGEN
jgi:hypothetical protein